MDLICQTDTRRDSVRSRKGRNGLDYVEVDDAQLKLYVYFLGKLPPEFSKNRPGLEQYLRVDGGERITGIRILDVDPQVDPDPERDDYLAVRIDRAGDFSAYVLSLVGVEGIDPRYQTTSFSFKLCCPSELDCQPACGCEPPALDEPRINYLAKDYSSFRQLIFDRLALLVPDWTERHVPDLGVTLVELLAYVGDYLSYHQDAVATEAYLGTARQRISVRRHARLVDYRLHEGCNARAWVCLETTQDLQLPFADVAFITGLNDALSLQQSVLDADQLQSLPHAAYEYFEPLVVGNAQALQLRQAHNEIQFHTWGGRECCLMQGATLATLLDHWATETAPPAPADAAAKLAAGTVKKPARALNIQIGDVLVFEEVLGARTGAAADANPKRRWAVRVTRAEATEDSLYAIRVGEGEATQKLSTPIVEIEWATEDALPFSLCLSTIGAAPDCACIPNVSVVRGNVVLVDHGRKLDPEPLGPVPGATGTACCECEGHPSDVVAQSGRYRPMLQQTPLTFRQPLPDPPLPASQCLIQDVRAATAALGLSDDSGARWTIQPDLLGSMPDDRVFVAELDNDGMAHLRFGNGELGRRPTVGSQFDARYRIGNGSKGNVGADAISRLILKHTQLDGVSISVRNPLPAQGGIDAEPIAEAKLFAPTAFRKQIERAIIADDYAEIAGRNRALQRAVAQLAWTGSWYEADVAVDPWNLESADRALLDSIAGDLYRYRRMGHDLHMQPAVYVPLRLALEVCALPGYDRGHVLAALLERFGNRRAADGSLGFFHPDALSFGDGVYLSRIVAAAQAVSGVECVTVVEFHRCFQSPNRELQNGVLPLAAHEIAQLDNDPNFPERGQLQITVRGGR
jgi:hypothetical protein